MKRKRILYFVLIILVALIAFISYIYFKNINNDSTTTNITGHWSYYSYYIYDNDKLSSKIEGISDEYLDLKDGKMNMCVTAENGDLQCISGTYKIDKDFVYINSNDYVFHGIFSSVIKDNKLILTKVEDNNKYVYTFIGAAG